MAPITVDPQALSGAGESIGSVGDEIAAAVGTLASSLFGGARSGLDPAGLVFGHAYQQSAQGLLDAAAAAVNAGRGVGFGVQMSATNYSRADAASTIGGGATALTPPDAPGEFSAPASPSALGGGVPPPLLWSVIQTFIPDVWPDGDPGALRATGNAWQSFATTISGIAGHLGGPSAVVAGQQIPEGTAMGSAISELTLSLSAIASESGNLATQTLEFADDVENTQNAIRDLMDRVSPSGFLDGLSAVFSGDALEELKEIADDVKAVLEGYGHQAEARRDTLQIAMGAIDDAIVSVEKWARREFPKYLGEDVGNALATALDFELTLGQGILAGGVDLVEGVGQFDPLRFAYDPEGAADAWAGMAESLGESLTYATPTGVMANPIGAFNHYKDQVTDAVHAEDWSSDRPGYGLGKILFDVGTAVVPGGAALRTTKLAGEAVDGAIPSPGRLPDAPGNLDNITPIGQRAEDITTRLDNLDDNLVPSATPNPSGPGVPPSLAEPPQAPKVPDAPGSRVPDPPPLGDRTPVAPHNSTPTSTPHAPDAPPVDRTPTTPQSLGGQHATPPQSASSVPPGSAPTPVPAMAGHAPEPSSIAAHAPAGASSGDALDAPPPAAHAPSSTTPEAPLLSHGDSPGSETGGGGENTPPHEPDGRVGHDGDSSDGHRTGDDPGHRDTHHPRTGAEAFPDAHDYGDLSEEQFDREFRNDDGSVRYPDEDDPSKPYAIPETARDLTPAEIRSRLDGEIWDRLGHPGGKWLAPEGTPYPERAVAPGSLEREYHGYRIHAENPLPAGWRIEESRVAPWFGQPGGGLQYRIIAPPGVTPRVQDLIDTDFLEELW